jgi:WD40 repeat protein
VAVALATVPPPVAPAAPPARPVAVPLSQESIAALPNPLAVPVALAPSADGAPQAAETVPPSVHDSVPSVTIQKPTGPLARARDVWRRLGRRGQIIAGSAAAAVFLILLIVPLWPKSKKPDEPPPPDTVLDRLNPEQIPPEDRAGVQRSGLKDLVVAVLGEHRVRLTGGFTCMALSPDRKKVAVGDGSVVRVVDTHTLRQDYELTKHTSTVYGVAYSANGKFLVSGGHDRAVRLWDAASGNLVREFLGAHEGAVLAVALSPEGKEVLSAGDDTKIHVWSVTTGDQLGTFSEHKTPVRALVVTPDGRLACSAGGTQQEGKDADRDVHVWEVATTNQDRVLTGHRGYVNRLEISPDGKHMLAGTDKSEVPIWDLVAGSLQPVSLVVENGNVPTNATFVGDDRVVTCGTNGVLKPWVPNKRGGFQDLDPLPPRMRASPPGLAWIRDVPRENRKDAEKGDGLLFVADSTLHVVNLERKNEWRPPLGHTQAVRQLTFLGDGDWLVSAGDDRTVRFWNLAGLYDKDTDWPREGRKTIGIPFSNNNQTFRAAAVSRDGNLALTVLNTDNYVQVWPGENNKDGLPLRKLDVKGGAAGDALLAVALNGDGTRALTAGTDKALRLWDVTRGVELRKMEGLSGPCSHLAYLGDGWAYSWDGSELRLWEGLGDTEKPQFVAMRAGGSALALSPGRDLAVIGQGNGEMKRWTELAKGQPLSRDMDHYHKGGISTLSLSPDRKLLLAGSADPRLGLWELTKDPIPEPDLYELRGTPSVVTFAPDGRHAALANPDGTIYILRLPVAR